MSVRLRVYLICASLGFLCYVLHMVRQDKFLLRYSFVWTVIGVLGVVAALCPEAVQGVASLLGFAVPSNLLFVGSILFLMVNSIVFLSALSKQQKMIERLVQELSMLKQDYQDRENAPKN